MATLLTLEGMIAGVGPVGTVGENNTKKQYLILHVPQMDAFGNETSKVDQWCLSAIGDNVDRLSMSELMVGKKAKVNLYLNSNYIEPREPGQEPLYIINANIAKVHLTF